MYRCCLNFYSGRKKVHVFEFVTNRYMVLKDMTLFSFIKVYLKLENLQPVNSFKIRGAAAAITKLTPKELEKGVYTASAGNFAQGLALAAQQLNVPCRVVVPDNAPSTKLNRITSFGASVIKVPYDVWWNIMTTHVYPGETGHFIHPTCQEEVIEGLSS